MADVTPEQAEEGMKPWIEWMVEVGDKLVDGGQPLMGVLASTRPATV